ncbi:hypothetical protein [Romboutsia lituseburensis]|uniref:hypothetical protein n=1 Tax=Romboutsia lituseburensis TaxID=1537 RepID=UPI0022EB7196|nr:hypothetical protein [Romboutsia lituseburensis]
MDDLKDKENKDVDINTFTKEQIINSNKYRKNRDLLTAILTSNNHYSIKQVDELIENFKKREVK